MPVFRVEKTRDYTVMSNHHLRDMSLSLKAKGLLSQMLSLPENWDYTLSGLCTINRESRDAIRSAINELEQAGYIERRQTTDSRGRFSSNEYIIHESPISTMPEDTPPSDPSSEKPTAEKPTQLNTDRSSKDQTNTDRSNTDSFPIPSPLPLQPERNGRETATEETVEIYRELLKSNIEYDHLLQTGIDKAELDGILDLLTETVCTARKSIRIAGDDYPAQLVKSKLLKLNNEHIEFAIDCSRTPPESATSRSICWRCCSTRRPPWTAITLPWWLTTWRREGKHSNECANHRPCESKRRCGQVHNL